MSLSEILFCIQQLLTHPNHRGSTYDPEEYRENVQHQAQKYCRNDSDFLERAMVELVSKIDPEYKQPLESWENERWENVEEAGWKGQRSFQIRNEARSPRRNLSGNFNGAVTMASPIEDLEEGQEVEYLMSTNSSASLFASSSNDENNDENDNENNENNTATSPNQRAVLAPIANANSAELTPQVMPMDIGHPRDIDGNICRCSCCEQGSRTFIDRNHKMRYIFGEGG